MTPFKWDATKWGFYSQCPFKYAEKWIFKSPEGPPSPAILNGRRAHVNVENMLLHGAPDVYGIHAKAKAAVNFVAAHEDKLVEKKLTFNRDWQQVPNRDPAVWLTIKCDAIVQQPWHIHVIDWKTGKTRASEYGDQLELYKLVAAVQWESENYLSTIVNLDDGKFTDSEETPRLAVLSQRDKWIERANTMETDNRFEPKPNQYCRWCPFGASKGGRCRYG